MENSYKVYCHTNMLNGKKYIGITKQKTSRRWRSGFGYGKKSHFAKSIKKYGWGLFKHEVLFDSLTKEEAIEKEIYLINKLDLMNGEKGYNSTSGGETTTFSKEVRDKMSKQRKDYYKNPENHKKLVKQNRKRFLDDPTLAKRLSQAHIDLQVSPIYCIELKRKFNSIKKASKELGIHKNSICAVLNGRQKTAGGYHFIYMDKKDIEKNDIRRSKENKLPRDYRGVLCVNSGKIYKTCRDAERELGITRGKVSWACNSQNNKTKGYSFKYVKEKKKIFCLTNNKVYDCLKDASNELNIPSGRIGEVCRGTRKSAGGYIFTYEKEDLNEPF